MMVVMQEADGVLFSLASFWVSAPVTLDNLTNLCSSQ